MIKLTQAEQAVHQKIDNSIKKKMDQKIAEIISEINKKTIFYALWSLAGIFLIFISLPRIIFYIFSLLMILAVFYFLIEFFKLLKKTLFFINNFEREIQKIVKKEIQSSIKNSISKKIGFFMSGLNQIDIENRCISSFIRELIRHLKKYKLAILIRVFAYTTAVSLFQKVLFSMLA
ncbi:MAG: hypothetical protein OXJ52_01425 [Oligoflexia bacterium]|nr:hypothetical protein [Oligoflexia bacterium]